MARKKVSEEDEVAAAVGGVALLASIVGNLAQHAKNADLGRTVGALHRVVKDWQMAYHTLDAQLGMALAGNEHLNGMVSSLREELRLAQARAYAAEQRALEAEARVENAAAGRGKRRNAAEGGEAGNT